MEHTVYPNVQIGANAVIEDYVIIGVPPRGRKPGELPTVIGDDAVIRSHTVIYAGNTIGRNFQTGHHVLVREENTIGDNVSIGSSTVIEHHIRMENNVRIHSQAFVPEMSVLEEGAWIGPNAVITNAAYPLSPNVKNELKGALIRKNAKVGANATLLPGVTIGENALVGAGSVVTKDVPPNKVVAGNPAKVINDISKLPYGERQ
ncbi:MAG TPA: DapH/DapD/GlmU-related protein [Bacteroidota bacterium]|nr:DapH/DapD/GlmU-related protein [Bacteroidota bacterium]